jgi:2-iminobutanoate/2-iminopropanoate deaminase
MPESFSHPAKKTPNPVISGAVLADGWLYVSGQGPLSVETGEYVPGTIEDETTRTLQHIDDMVQAAGGSKADIVKCTCYLSDLSDFAGFHQAYADFFSGVRPARTTVRADLLRGIKVEIDAVARIDK